MKVIKVIKPSVSLAHIEEYSSFKLDYERRTHKETIVEEGNKLTMYGLIGAPRSARPGRS